MFQIARDNDQLAVTGIILAGGEFHDVTSFRSERCILSQTLPAWRCRIVVAWGKPRGSPQIPRQDPPPARVARHAQA